MSFQPNNPKDLIKLIAFFIVGVILQSLLLILLIVSKMSPMTTSQVGSSNSSPVNRSMVREVSRWGEEEID